MPRITISNGTLPPVDDVLQFRQDIPGDSDSRRIHQGSCALMKYHTALGGTPDPASPTRRDWPRFSPGERLGDHWQSRFAFHSEVHRLASAPTTISFSAMSAIRVVWISPGITATLP